MRGGRPARALAQGRCELKRIVRLGLRGGVERVAFDQRRGQRAVGERHAGEMRVVRILAGVQAVGGEPHLARRFVDVLDPTFLERFDKPKHLARLSLLDGSVKDVKALVSTTFGAKYVICGYLPARRLLDESADFVRLRPPPGPPLPLGSGPYVYEVKE